MLSLFELDFRAFFQGVCKAGRQVLSGRGLKLFGFGDFVFKGGFKYEVQQR